MKTISNYYIIVFLQTFAFVSCEKDCVKQNGIYGEWVWTKSSGFATITPESEGYSKKLMINDFIFKEFINDSLIFESQYDLVIRTDTLIGQRNFIEFLSGSELRIEINESKLILDPVFPDALIEYYDRK